MLFAQHETTHIPLYKYQNEKIMIKKFNQGYIQMTTKITAQNILKTGRQTK